VRYEVDYTWGEEVRGEQPKEAFSAADMAQHIEAVYEDASRRGGRVIASHTLILEGEDHIFFVSEFPD
jgi:hypothetical protein